LQGLNVQSSHSKETKIEDSVAAEVAAIWKGVQKLRMSQSDIPMETDQVESIKGVEGLSTGK
jgi:hypothetical protein